MLNYHKAWPYVPFSGVVTKRNRSKNCKKNVEKKTVKQTRNIVNKISRLTDRHGRRATAFHNTPSITEQNSNAIKHDFKPPRHNKKSDGPAQICTDRQTK